MNIGKKLQEFRNKHNLSEDEVAEKLNITRQTLSNWENNKSYPDILYIIELSEIYNISLDELIKSDTNMIKHIKDNVDTVKSNEKVSKRLLINSYIKIITIGCMCIVIVLLLNNIITLSKEKKETLKLMDKESTNQLETINEISGLYTDHKEKIDLETEEVISTTDYILYLRNDGRYIYKENNQGHIGNYYITSGNKIILNHLYSFKNNTKSVDITKTEVTNENNSNILSFTSLDKKKLKLMDTTFDDIEEYKSKLDNEYNSYLK